MIPSGDDASLFSETSIQIARRVHRPEIQDSIRQRLAEFPQHFTGLVVRAEFKRRLLAEARYLLLQLARRGSYEKVRRHVQDSLPVSFDGGRKKQICLQTLTTIDENDTDEDRTDRSRFYLQSLLRFGLRQFDAQATKVLTETGCACGASSIREKKAFLDYDLGPTKCERTTGCGIGRFLADHRDLLVRILAHIESVKPQEKTKELTRTEQFIRDYLADPKDVERRNPCTIVGDLLIAMESKSVRAFYTMNYKESQHLCRVLAQRLIYRPPNSDHPEIDCPANTEFPRP